LPVNKIHMFGVRFIENSIIDNKQSTSGVTMSFTSDHNNSVSGGCL
jgi:hypothetical protein